MANRWSDGFGRYGGDKTKMLNGSSSQAWAQVDGNWSLSSANPRTGTHHLRLASGSGSATVRRVFGAPLTEVLFGFAINAAALPAGEPTESGGNGVALPIVVDQANGAQLTFILGTDGAIAVYRGMGTGNGFDGFDNGVLLGRTVPVIGAGAYQHIEVYLMAGAASDGAIEIRVDEVTRLNLTGITTVATANVEFSQIKHYATLNSSKPGTIDIADCYVNDTTDDGSGCNTFIGDCKSGVRMVSADTAQADFTLSAGVLGYDLLDETPPDDATYITTDATTAESDFEIETGPANLTEILTARPFVRAWKDDAGTCELGPSLISNSVKATVTAQPIATAPSYYDSNVPLDPNTDAPWQPADLAAAIEAIERTA